MQCACHYWSVLFGFAFLYFVQSKNKVLWVVKEKKKSISLLFENITKEMKRLEKSSASSNKPLHSGNRQKTRAPGFLYPFCLILETKHYSLLHHFSVCRSLPTNNYLHKPTWNLSCRSLKWGPSSLIKSGDFVASSERKAGDHYSLEI